VPPSWSLQHNNLAAQILPGILEWIPQEEHKRIAKARVAAREAKRREKKPDAI
jgi:hypothetical protein